MYSEYSHPIVNKPKRRVLLIVVIVVATLVVAGGVGFFLAMGVSRVNEDATVKDELITQNARLRSNMIDGELRPESIATTKSTETVSISLNVAADYRDYCIEASLLNSRNTVQYHMYEDTPDLEPIKGLCGDNATEKPSQPMEVVLGSVGSTSASFSWTSIPNASEYVVRCATSTISGTPLTNTTKTAQGTVTGLAANATYNCDVAAKNSLGQSDWSAKVSMTTSGQAATVKDLKIETVSSSSLSYSWSAVPGAREYIIEYATDTSFSKDLKQIKTTQTKGTINGLTRFGGYFFHVKAVTDAQSESMAPFSTVVQGRTAE